MNNTIKKIASVTFALGTLAWADAQKSDAKSKQILDAVANKYKANKNTYFKFAYGTGSQGKVSKTQTGIFYTTPSQYKLKIMGIEQLFDGQKVYNISEEDQEVTIAKANGNEMMFSPTNYLNSYKTNYNTQYVGKRTLNGTSTELIKLTPIKNNGIKNVFIFVDAAKNQLVKVEQYNSNNDVAIIQIQDYRTNQNLAADLFRFNRDKYQNYVITEL
ncbi:LolA family protein [Bergeyella sp. RCAD1439]|uniref:LolA family protein n=1 Tax=Bergeyella anatis TaxID=3113737 RepID=UPI002E19014B|nr:outer membrane lipoprotein carrier protein LolA [Bergeyella sp. RCAD1439]